MGAKLGVVFLICIAICLTPTIGRVVNSGAADAIGTPANNAATAAANVRGLSGIGEQSVDGEESANMKAPPN
ncbi:hypothetical protein U1Q18_008990 [Sarracenia purpurea var. burkii]